MRCRDGLNQLPFTAACILNSASLFSSFLYVCESFDDLGFCEFFFVGREIFFQFREEAFAFGGHVFVFQLGQLAEQSLFLFAEFLGDFDDDLDEQIAEAAAARVGHAFAAELEDGAGLRAGGDLDFAAAIERGHFERGAERGLGVGNRHAANEVLAIALEQRMGRAPR